jgi:hypothetical protein
MTCSILLAITLSVGGCSTFHPRAGDLPYPERPRLTWTKQGAAYCLSEGDAGALDQYLRKIEVLRAVSE